MVGGGLPVRSAGDYLAADLAEADDLPVRARRGGADHDLVAVFEEATPSAFGQFQGLGAVAGQFQQAAELVAAGTADRARREQVSGADRGAATGHVREHLRR